MFVGVARELPLWEALFATCTLIQNTLHIMADKALVSMAEQFSGLPMDTLIAGPLNAATKANAAMAMTQTKFLLDTCFVRKGEGEKASYQPLMITMQLDRAVIAEMGKDEQGNTVPPSIQTASTSFKLPLLTIVPLNSLAVDEINIEFEMEVKSSFSESTSEKESKSNEQSGSFSAKCGFGCFSAEIKGSASSKSESSKEKNSHYEKSNTAKYSFRVHAGQLPLPQGVTTIISAFASAIDPITIES